MNIKSRMKYDKEQQVHWNILLPLFKQKCHYTFIHYGVQALSAKNIHLFTRFHTGAAITPFCTLVTVITSSVAPSAL